MAEPRSSRGNTRGPAAVANLFPAESDIPLVAVWGVVSWGKRLSCGSREDDPILKYTQIYLLQKKWGINHMKVKLTGMVVLRPDWNHLRVPPSAPSLSSLKWPH